MQHLNVLTLTLFGGRTPNPPTRVATLQTLQPHPPFEKVFHPPTARP